MAQGDVRFPTVNRNGNAYNLAYVSGPTWAVGLEVWVSGLDIDGNFFCLG